MSTARLHVIDGEIRGVSSCSTGLGDPEPVAEGVLLDVDLAPGEPLPTGETHRVVAGELVPYTPEQRAAKSRRPRHPARWDNASMAWVDLRTPADLARIEAARVDAEIRAIEGLTARALREAVLAVAAGEAPPAAALQRLADADARIAQARQRRPGDMPPNAAG